MDKRFELIRLSSYEDGTFGVLLESRWIVTKIENEIKINKFINIPFAVTLEPEWKNNRADISCIPAGEYVCKRIVSPKFGETFEVTNVPGRENILFHWGNYSLDTHGCIVVAEKFGALGGKTVVQESKSVVGEGFNEFMARLLGIKEFTLKIKECYF